MNLTSIPLLDLLRQQMGWLSARQDVLSQNVANADIPGYSARDLKPLDFGDLLNGGGVSAPSTGGLTVTDPQHITVPSGSTDGFTGVSAGDDSIDVTGNSVSVEEEMMKVADTQAQYQAATNLYAKAIGMMRTAIDKSSGT